MSVHDLQPDQQPECWDRHVEFYEAVFEPLTLGFMQALADQMQLAPGSMVLDVGAGCGGAALALSAQRHQVTAVDASPAMVARMRARAETTGADLTASVMDGMALTFPDGVFDAAISVFGVILFPDAAAGLREMRRVVRRRGRVGLVTWTDPARYELATTLREAIIEIRGESPIPSRLPAQLRFVTKESFHALFSEADLAPEILTVERRLTAPSARWLAERIAFAPGMEAMLDGLGSDRQAVLENFITRLERKHGTGTVHLPGWAFLGTATIP